MNMNAYHKVFCVVIKYSLSLSASSFQYHIWMHIRKVLLKYSLSLATSSSSTLATSSDCTWQFQFSQCSLWVSSDLWQKFSTLYQVVAFITMMYFSCMRNRCQRWAFYAWVIIILEYGSEWFLLCSFFLLCCVFLFSFYANGHLELGNWTCWNWAKFFDVLGMCPCRGVYSDRDISLIQVKSYILDLSQVKLRANFFCLCL